MVEEHGLSQANKAWTADIQWTVGSHPAVVGGQEEVKVPTPTPNHCAMTRQGELHGKHLVTFGTTNSSGQCDWKTYWATILPFPLFFYLAMRLPDDPLPAQTGKNTSFSIIRDHITKHSSTNWPPPVSRHEQNHSLLTNHFQIFSNKTFLSKG